MRRLLSIGSSGVTFASGGTTNNVIPKSNGASQLQNSSITDDGATVTSTDTGGFVGAAFSSSTANSAAAGVFRLPSTGTVSWRNNANGADVALGKTGAVSGSIAADSFDLSGFGAVRVPVGAVGTPAILFNGTTAGIFQQGTWGISFASDSITTDMVVVPSGQLQVPSGGSLRWSGSSSNAGSAGQTFLTSPAAANVQLGFNAAAAPVAQTLSVQSATATNTDQAAGNWTFNASQGTGLGAVGRYVFQAPALLATSGTTVQTNVIRVAVNATKALTSGAATTILSIPLATLQMGGGNIQFYLEASDGTSQATLAGEVAYACENSAGVFVVNTSVVGTSATACTATKTLAAAFSMTSANPCLLQITPTLTGITASANKFNIIYEVHHMGQTNPTV